MLAAENGHSDTVKVLLEAGAAIEAKNIVSKRISICTTVCMCMCNIIKWLTVIQNKRERERKKKESQKEIPTDWESERKK